jgi:hypothetical protein
MSSSPPRSLDCRENTRYTPGSRENWRNFAYFKIKPDWRKCPTLPAGQALWPFSLKGHWQSSFNEFIRRTQCDRKPMMRRKPGSLFVFRHFAI